MNFLSVTQALLRVCAVWVALIGVPLQARAQDLTPRPSNSAAIQTLDLAATVKWYEEYLGFRQVSVDNLVQERRVVLERRGFLLEVVENERATASVPDVDRTSSLANPAVSILVADVDKEIAALRKRGVEILLEPRDELDGSFRAATIADNEHHAVELREPLGSPGGYSYHPAGR